MLLRSLYIFILVLPFLLLQVGGMFNQSLHCAPDCDRGPFTSAQAVAQHQLRCSAWSAHLWARAEKRTLNEDVSGDDEDPALTRRKCQKLRRSKNLKPKKPAMPGPLPLSTPIASTSGITSQKSPNPELPEIQPIASNNDTCAPLPSPPRPESPPVPHMGIEEATPELTTAGRPIRATRGQLPARFRDILPRAAPAAVSTLEALQADTPDRS
ncbi:hypothetical protein C8R42DRAFT_640261 [Lentinula raphanica]|nr:hypothetical protein C8R42DRAFT_640261 [Lentinula raphanica]